MLRRAAKKHYYVYPSYARFWHRWEDLPRLFSDPCKYSPSWQLNPFNPREYGYPETIQPYELVDGPLGGGIIISQTGFSGKVPEKWLPDIIFIEGANICSPDSMYETDHFEVSYLEPKYNKAADYGVEDPVKQYHICSTVEHVEAAGDRIFWLLDFAPGRKTMGMLADLPSWAEHLGVTLKCVDTVPHDVAEEIGPWLLTPNTRHVCYEVSSTSQSMGYHFAVLIYFGLHLASLAPRLMKRVHLLAQIEGRIRSSWWSRWARRHGILPEP